MHQESHATKAAASLARTIDYDKQAAEDAAAADKAAGNAEGYAKDARASADQAELDASAARSAATQADQDAKDARAAADRADTAATEAEQAAKDADKYAKEAQRAAEQTEDKKNGEPIQTGTILDAEGHIGNVFYVVDHYENIGDPETLSKTSACDDWKSRIVYTGDCTITAKITYKAILNLYLCTADDLNPAYNICPSGSAVYLGQQPSEKMTKEVTHTITIAEFNANIDPIDILFGSWIDCGKKIGSMLKITSGGGGNWGGCGWAAFDVASLFAGKIVRAIADAVRAVDASLRTGIGVADALKALRTLRIDADALAGIERSARISEEFRAACETNSFPGATEVLMADGSRRPISQVGVGDRLTAMDPATGRLQTRQVTDTFKHDTQRLVDITVADGGKLASTAGHKFYVVDRGWTLVSDLHVGDRLRTPDGSVHPVTALLDRSGLTPRTVYDLTVDDLHTFFVLAGATPILVHNCKVALG
ncbi:Hint domain-containing protein [Streptomyces mirabilis]|uniref:Hint domain-containing protein n=2 Tax=Streptomyces mirabilis TaxID=68239 RepID=UPI0033FFF8F3